MRGLILFIFIVAYLFSLVYIENQLVKTEIRKEQLKKRWLELQVQKKELEFKLTEYCNLARIEADAKNNGYVFPAGPDILGVIGDSHYRQ